MRWTRRCRVRMRSQGEVKLVSDRERRARRAAFRGRSKRVVLAPVAGVKLRGGSFGPTGCSEPFIRLATVARRIRRREELAIHRKTIAWGMPDVSGASAVNTG